MHRFTSRVSLPPLRPLNRLLLTAGVALACLPAHADFKIVNGVLQESNGTPFVMRGANAPHAWYPDKTAQTLTDLSARGANTVRLVLSNGVKWTMTQASDVASLIAEAKAARLIAVLEVHDTTGYGEQSGMSTLDQAANYWIGIKSALIGQEDYVIVNIGNEPLGNNQAASAWIDGHKNAIAKMRAAGIRNTLMVDGANWGQDWQNIMRSNAASVFASDPLANTIFSIHMYSVYPTDSTVNDYLSAFLSAKLPIVVGEFGNTFQGQTVAASAIMSRAVQYGVGYLGWSWSGNGGSDAALDLVYNFDGNSLSSWGTLLFNDANGVTATSKRATIFNGGGTATLPGAPTVTPTAGDGQVALSWNAASGASTYEVARSNSASGSFATIASGLTTTSYTDASLSNGTTYYYTVSARNSAGATASAVVSATPKATTVVPTMPNVTATAGDGTVALSWSAQSNVTSYAISRSQSQNSGFAAVTTLAGSATAYTDSGLANGTAYYYHVTASNSAGDSPVASVVATPVAASNAACALTVDGSGDWGTGQVLRVILTNNGNSTINTWSVAITESNDFTINSTWNATFSKSGRNLAVTPVDWSRTISPGSHIEAGLQMSYSGGRPVVTAASVAGSNCAVTLK
jgi:mannan endo-1,4-beta-mannosidase